jgi:hypothetical protein
MRAPSKALLLGTAVHLALVACPAASFAQSQSAAPPAPLPPLPPSAPRPQGAGEDVLYTKGGGLLRGTIIDAIPDAQARIQLVTGEIATVPWQQILRIERAGTPAALPSPAAKPPPPASDVWVHLEASDGIVLQQDRTNDDDWQTVCAAPCDRQLPTNFYYRVTGGGIKSSADFALHAPQGTREKLTVDGASKSAFVLGIVGLVGGLVVGYLGLVVVDVGASESVLGEGNSSGTTGAGLAMMGIGAVAAIGGLILVIANAKTKVGQDLGTSQAGLVLPVASSTRASIWATAPSEQRSLPPIAGIPILSGRF